MIKYKWEAKIKTDFMCSTIDGTGQAESLENADGPLRLWISQELKVDPDDIVELDLKAVK